jgi:hypothetical protein
MIMLTCKTVLLWSLYPWLVLLTKAAKRNALALEGEEPVARLYEANNSVNNYIQFKLKKPVANDADITPYVTDLRELYFSMNVRLSHGDSVRREVFEKVEGFIPVQPLVAGVDYGKSNDGNFGWLRLPQLHNGDEMSDRNTVSHRPNF